MRKIFIMYPWYWPHYKAGGPVQSIVNFAHVFKEKVRIHSISHIRDIDGSQSSISIPTRQWISGPAGEQIMYLDRFYPWLVSNIIRSIAPDVLWINGLYNVETSLLGAFVARAFGISVVVSPRGMLQAWGMRRGATKKKLYLALFRALVPHNATWHATDEKEADEIRHHFGASVTVSVAANIPRTLTPLNNLVLRKTEPIRLIFLSLINPNKNVHIVIDAVRAAAGRVILDIYGPIIDAAYWKKCKDLIAGTQTIQYRGPVLPWDVPGVMRGYHFFVLPTSGENFGHAIFDALTSSVPVIVSRNTPWKAIDDKAAGFYIDIAVDSLTMVLQNLQTMSEAEYSAMRMAAHAYASEFWRKSSYAKEYEFLLQ